MVMGLAEGMEAIEDAAATTTTEQVAIEVAVVVAMAIAQEVSQAATASQ